ncbi:MAG: hypothetical protein PHE53_07100 [Thermoguttaceae bacterium]|nr:hypothetical protein [Thermoguttaceae bacterium]
MKRRVFLLSCASLTVIHGIGCTPRQKLPEGMGKPVPVSITITQEGKPLADADVSLFPPDLSAKWAMGGRTNADGVVKIYTNGEIEGCPSGEYVVLVRKMAQDSDKDLGPEPEDAIERMKWNEKKAASSHEYSLVEDKYNDVKTSDLKIKVDGKTEATLDVGKAVKVKVKLLQ